MKCEWFSRSDDAQKEAPFACVIIESSSKAQWFDRFQNKFGGENRMVSKYSCGTVMEICEKHLIT